MTQRRDSFVEALLAARARQFLHPGSESDVAKRPNDWVGTIINYLAEATDRFGVPATREDFEDALVKAGAVILAALEHSEDMQNKKRLR